MLEGSPLDRKDRPTIEAVVAMAVLGVIALGFVDYATGTQVRVFPLYFIPVSAAAWWAGRPAALSIAFSSAVAWFASNYLAGQRISPWIEGINFFMQLGSFSLVGLLIAGLRSAHRRERARSHADPLTGLLNGRGIFDEAPRSLALAHRHRLPMTVAFLDLDNFKRVNDTLGHAAGDEVLRTAALTLREELRGGDFAARLGGDEFLLLLPQTDEVGARRVLERVHGRLQEQLRSTCPVAGASMGAVVYLRPPDDLEAVVKRADAVMYSVKTSGRGRVIIEVEAEAEAEAKVELEGATEAEIDVDEASSAEATSLTKGALT